MIELRVVVEMLAESVVNHSGRLARLESQRDAIALEAMRDATALREARDEMARGCLGAAAPEAAAPEPPTEKPACLAEAMAWLKRWRTSRGIDSKELDKLDVALAAWGDGSQYAPDPTRDAVVDVALAIAANRHMHYIEPKRGREVLDDRLYDAAVAYNKAHPDV